MNLINKKLFPKQPNIIKNVIMKIILIAICFTFLPTLNIEGKTNELDNKVVIETSLNKFEKNINNHTIVHPKKNDNLTRNVTTNMKQANGNVQPAKWSEEVLDRLNIVIEQFKGKFSSLDMILMPLDLNSNQWINH